MKVLCCRAPLISHMSGKIVSVATNKKMVSFRKVNSGYKRFFLSKSRSIKTIYLKSASPLNIYCVYG